jgi:hypothetical protein
MRQGTGLSLSLVWASSASAQRAVDAFCYPRDRTAAIEAGAALEYAAKAVVVHLVGPHEIFLTRRMLTEAELWVAGDHVLRAGEPPKPEEIAAARRALLKLKTIDPRAAVDRALTLVDEAKHQHIRGAAKLVVDARNAAAHLGDIDVPVGGLADAFVTAVEAMWALIPAASGSWGLFSDVARVGTLGRRDSWQQDKAIRLAQARDRFHGMGTIFVRRSHSVAGLHDVQCAVCHSAAYYNPVSRDPSPPVVPRAEDDSVALLDCVVCGLTLWGPQIGAPEYRVQPAPLSEGA